jgi:hypothetical protein
MKENDPVQKLLYFYPKLMKINGMFDVASSLSLSYQMTLSGINRKKWIQLKKDNELKSALELIIIEFFKKQKKACPKLKEVDNVFENCDCKSLSYFLYKIGLFEKSYNKILILANLPLNRKFFKNSP